MASYLEDDFINGMAYAFLKQISRLTYFTRFDPVEPKEHVFSVEQSSKNLEMITSQTDEMGREQESSNGKVCPHSKGGSFSCLS